MRLLKFLDRQDGGAVKTVQLTRGDIEDAADYFESNVNRKRTRISPLEAFDSPDRTSAHVGQWLVLYPDLEVYKYWPDKFNRRFAPVEGGETEEV
jgi:hypothetical protein